MKKVIDLTNFNSTTMKMTGIQNKIFKKVKKKKHTISNGHFGINKYGKKGENGMVGYRRNK